MRYLSPGRVSLAAVVAMLAFATYTNVRTQRAPIQEIPQPNHMVSFAADFVQTETDGSRWTGKYYRRGDQSFAMHGTELFNGTAVAMVTIANAASLSHYLYRDTTGYWVRVPMKSGPPTEPLRYRLKTPELSGLLPETEPIAGFTVYRQEMGDGSMRLLAPDLNFFPLLMQLRSGMRQELSNVQLTEPDPAVFLPPPGAKVVDGKSPQAHAR